MADISEEILFQIFDFLPSDQFYFILEKAKGVERLKNAFLKKYRIIRADLISENTYILIEGKKISHSFFDLPSRTDLIIGTKYWYRLGYLHRENKPAVQFTEDSIHNEYWENGQPKKMGGERQ